MDVWKETAVAGDARSQFLYGLCLYYEQDQDEETAAAWFMKSTPQHLSTSGSVCRSSEIYVYPLVAEHSPR